MTNSGNDPIRSTRSSSSAESTGTCAQCGHLVSESSRFCPECGARVPLLRTGEVFEDKYEVVRLIGIQVLNGLGAIHSAGIVHRDISPETILIADAPGATREGATVRAKIADLGIAKGLEPISEDAATEAGRFMGNVQYSSPEQAGMSEELLDGRSDLYSLGVTLYEMLSGELPFRALTPQGYLERHVSSAPRSLRDAAPDRNFPARLDAVISKAIEKDREKRFQTAAEFRDALLEARKDLGAVHPKRASKQASAAEAPAKSVAPAIPEVGDVPAGVSDREVTLPAGVEQPRDVAPQSGTERDGFATTPLASSAATRDVSAANTYDPLARKKIRWGTWLSVALLAALVLWVSGS